MQRYLIALDLHGTLLDLHWQIPPQLIDELCNLINSFKDFCDFYVCTGNDSSFVEKYLPAKLKKCIDGLILESGCIIQTAPVKAGNNNSPPPVKAGGGRGGASVKTYLTPQDAISQIKEIESYLKKQKYPFAKYFASREATVSIFTCDESGGEVPERFAEIVSNDLTKHKYAERFYLTWSNVALDIIPSGISKWSALKQIATDKKIISFMDSYNDKEIAQYSDFTFLPQNTAPALINHLRANNHLVFPLSRFHFFSGIAYLCQNTYTEAVIEGLRYLKTQIDNYER